MKLNFERSDRKIIGRESERTEIGYRASIRYDFTDEKGRVVGHLIRVWFNVIPQSSRTDKYSGDHVNKAYYDARDNKVMMNAHITRDGSTFGALQEDVVLGEGKVEDYFETIEKLMEKKMKQTEKAMEKRRANASGKDVKAFQKRKAGGAV